MARKAPLHLVNSTRDYLDGFTVRCVNRQGEVPLVLADRGGIAFDCRGERRPDPCGRRMLRRFGDAIEKGIPASPDFRDGLRVQLLLDQARESQATGDWIDVTERGKHD